MRAPIAGVSAESKTHDRKIRSSQMQGTLLNVRLTCVDTIRYNIKKSTNLSLKTDRKMLGCVTDDRIGYMHSVLNFRFIRKFPTKTS